MLRTIKIALGTAFTLPVLLVVPLATAATTTTTNSSTAPTSSSTTTTTTTTNSSKENDSATAAKDNLTAEQKKTTATRVAEVKASYKSTLTAIQIASLKSKCKAAQVPVKTLATKVDTNMTLRTTVYKDVLANIDDLIVKLKAGKISTTDLDAERTVLNSKIDAYDTAVGKYRLSLTDLQSQDCVSDPVAFEATLLATRTDQLDAATAATAIRTYVTATIKPTLKQVSADIKSNTTSSSTTTSGGTN